MGKVFAITSFAIPCTVNLKCDPEYALELREQYEEVQPGYHMNKKHWNTVRVDGPPGLGKTTLANIIANELGATIVCTSGPVIEKPGDLAGMLTKLRAETADEVNKNFLTTVPDPATISKGSFILVVGLDIQVNNLERLLKDYRRSYYEGGELSKLSTDNENMKTEIETSFRELLKVLESYYSTASRVTKFYKDKEYKDNLSKAAGFDKEMKDSYKQYDSLYARFKESVKKYKPVKIRKNPEEYTNKDEKAVVIVQNALEGTMDIAENFYRLVAIFAIMFSVVNNSKLAASINGPRIMFDEAKHDFGKVPQGPQDEKLGDTLSKVKTEIVPPQADYVKRVEEEKIKDEEYKASISALETKIKELEAKFNEAEAKAPESKTSVTTVSETRVELPPIDVVPPVIEERKKEIEAKFPVDPNAEEKKIDAEEKTTIPELGNLVVESDYTDEVKPVEEIIKPVFVSPEDVFTPETPIEDFVKPIEDFTKPIEESIEAPEIEKKIEERLAEIVKAPVKKAPKVQDPSTSNIDDLLRTLGTSIEEEDVIEEQAIEEKGAEDFQESKIEEVTDEFFIKTDTHTDEIEEKLSEIQEEVVSPIVEDKIEHKIEEKLPEIIEEKLPEVIEEKLPEVIEEKKLPDTPLVSEISDSELHKKVDSLIEEFRSESSKIKEEEEKEQLQIIEDQKVVEPEIVKVVPPEDMEEAQLSTALSSIFNSILSSENIKKEDVRETPIIKEEVQNLHNEIVKTEKHEEKLETPPVEEKKDTSNSSISDIYSSAKSFNDIFEQKSETKEEKEHADDMKQIEAMHEKTETNGHGLSETNGHSLIEANGHGLKEVSDSNLNESYGPGLTENGREHDVRTSKIYTNGNPLKPYPPSNGKNGNGASTLNQVLEDNGLHKESKTSIFIIVIIIVIALGLLFFAIFNSGIMGKENLSRKENNYGLTENGFTIQAGSFNDKESAIQKSKLLSDKKIDNVRIEELEKDNSTFFR
ncbi:unnamed protein product, partial [Rotaria sp. Silwood1]